MQQQLKIGRSPRNSMFLFRFVSIGTSRPAISRPWKLGTFAAKPMFSWIMKNISSIYCPDDVEVNGFVNRSELIGSEFDFQADKTRYNVTNGSHRCDVSSELCCPGSSHSLHASA